VPEFQVSPDMCPNTTRLNDAVERFADPVIEPTELCEHTMSLHFDPQGDYERGIVRCIVKREGDVTEPGFVDTSRVHVVAMESAYEGRVREELSIEGAQDVISARPEYATSQFLGFEDPNLWCDLETMTLHFYCTLPFLDRHTGDIAVYLGHAEGKGLDSLAMTEPVLKPDPGSHRGAKEVAIAPCSRDGVRYNLVESDDIVDGTMYSVLRTAVAPDLSGPWEYDGIALHPQDFDLDWCAGHVSPGPLLPQSFVDVGDDRRVGLLNGRERLEYPDDNSVSGTFAVGLLVYDYQEGTVLRVADRPLFSDPEAELITFASAFRRTGPDEGLIYAHVDDSSIRAYRVDATALTGHVPSRDQPC
jgi:hypothetical protein